MAHSQNPSLQRELPPLALPFLQNTKEQLVPETPWSFASVAPLRVTAREAFFEGTVAKKPLRKLALRRIVR